MSKDLIVVVGASAGGVGAVQALLQGLPKLAGPPVVIVQHIPATARIDLPMVYGRYFHGKVLEAGDKSSLESGHAYFCPPGYHLLIEKDRTLSLCLDEPVNFSRPSIDVFFESAAELGTAMCGVLLTGVNRDGAEGLLYIKGAGGYTIVQDPAEAETPYMPEAALALFRPDYVGTIAQIAQRIMQLYEEKP